MTAHDPLTLPDGLPVPVDDGAADHLGGMAVPPVALTASDGGRCGSTIPDRRLARSYTRIRAPDAQARIPWWRTGT